ncbi:hypothetical protein MNBD_GAMMA25-834 [hydrothermal vent metagenome]|uniref:DUF3579 domain-containing protein n=1 Tax=hydrothermal vent metagenome TaxID=652676 RepID=A0A3B1ARH4_9ZZZZ
MSRKEEEILVIHSAREDGGRLRPSDWIERISSTLASFDGDRRLHYSRSVQPCMIGDEKCLVVARGLEDSNPGAYEFIMNFANSNKLKIKEDRRFDDRALPV